MLNTLEDVSLMTNIPQKYLQKISQGIIYSICDSLTEDRDTNLKEFDIGIGTLLMFVDETCVKYKFSPSKALEEAVKTTLKTGNSKVTSMLEESVVTKILELYRDLF